MMILTMLNRLPRVPMCAGAMILIGMVGLAASAQPKLGNGPKQTKIPVPQDEALIEKGEQATQQYVTKYGPLSVSVVVAWVEAGGVVSANQPPMVRAIAAEVEKQLLDYTGGLLVLSSQAFDKQRAQRLIERQNRSSAPSQAFIDEVTQLAGAPYVIALEVGADTAGAKDAGVVTIRIIEVATGRVMATLSDQFWQDKKRYPDIPESVWVQHSVTYWMNELMGRRGYPKAIAGPYLSTLQFVGELPSALNAKLKSTVAEATGLPATAINPRRSRQGFDVVSIDLLLPDPPHVLMETLVQKISEALADEGLNAEPLRQVDGDLIFAVSRTPAWWSLTTDAGDSHPMRQAWSQFLNDAGSPSVLVLTHTDPQLVKAMSDAQATELAGHVRALSQTVSAQLSGSGANVIGVETVDANTRLGDLRDKARWVCIVEVLPTMTENGPPLALARLTDLQGEQVLGAAAFSDDAAPPPPSQPKPDGITHVARYLTGTIMANAIANPHAFQVMELKITDCPSFAFGNRVGNIVLAQKQTVDVLLPTFASPRGVYKAQVRYRGSTTALVDRLRADLSTLPLQVGDLHQGGLTLTYSE